MLIVTCNRWNKRRKIKEVRIKTIKKASEPWTATGQAALGQIMNKGVTFGALGLPL